MREKRANRHIIDGREIKDIIRRNTYGGSREERHGKAQEMPVLSIREGIKMEWERRAEKYPSTITVQMTDGEWVKYKIDIQQPGFQAAMDIIRNPAYKRGYPPENDT